MDLCTHHQPTRYLSALQSIGWQGSMVANSDVACGLQPSIFGSPMRIRTAKRRPRVSVVQSRRFQ